jgi:hypothetical protein
MLVFRFQERYILHFFPPKKRQNPYSDYLVLVLQQALYGSNKKFFGHSLLKTAVILLTNGLSR